MIEATWPLAVISPRDLLFRKLLEIGLLVELEQQLAEEEAASEVLLEVGHRLRSQDRSLPGRAQSRC